LALLGNGVAAMWCEIDPASRRDFEDWHAHEHLPERLTIQGFLRGSRWASRSSDAGIFVLYELSDLDVFASPAYLERLNRPTAWSTRMMPAIRNMVRSPCRVSVSAGAGLGCGLLSLRFTPAPGSAGTLRAWVQTAIASPLSRRPGLVAVHLLEAEMLNQTGQTTEQALRGGDEAASWALLVSGYDHEVIGGLLRHELSEVSLAAHGALPGSLADHYALEHVMLPNELPGTAG
jgi:hypothetical protein